LDVAPSSSGEIAPAIGELRDGGTPADGGELAADGAEIIQRAADLDQAVVQLVHGLGVLIRIVVVEVLVDDVADGLVAGGRWRPVMSGQRVMMRWAMIERAARRSACR
jgi:hypothetical protein